MANVKLWYELLLLYGTVLLSSTGVATTFYDRVTAPSILSCEQLHRFVARYISIPDISIL